MWVKVTAGVLLILTVAGLRIASSGVPLFTDGEPAMAAAAVRMAAPVKPSDLPKPESLGWTQPHPASQSQAAPPTESTRVATPTPIEWQTRATPTAIPARLQQLGVTAYEVAIDTTQIRNAMLGTAVAIEVPFTSSRYEFRIDSREVSGERISLLGHIEGNDPSYGLVVTLSERLFATLATPDGTFQIESAEGSTWLTSARDIARLNDTTETDGRIPTIDRWSQP